MNEGFTRRVRVVAPWRGGEECGIGCGAELCEVVELETRGRVVRLQQFVTLARRVHGVRGRHVLELDEAARKTWIVEDLEGQVGWHG